MQEISMTQKESILIYFEGHTFKVSRRDYSESLKIEKVI
jgi:hypothetical protein